MAQDFMTKIGVSMDISQVESAISKVEKALSGLGKDIVDPKATAQLTNNLEKLKQKVEDFKGKASNVNDAKDMTALLTAAKGITRAYDSLIAKIKVMGKMSEESAKKILPHAAIEKIEKAAEAMKKYQASVDKVTKAYNSQQAKINGFKAQQDGLVQSSKKSKEYLEALPGEIEKANKERQEAERLLKEYNKELEKAKKAEGADDGRTKAGRAVKELTAKRDEVQKRIGEKDTFLAGIDKEVAQAALEYKRLSEAIATNETRLKGLEQQLKSTSQEGLQTLRKELGEITGIDFTNSSLGDLEKAIKGLESGEVDALITKLRESGQAAEEGSSGMAKFSAEVKDAAEKAKEFDKQAGELSSLKSRIAYFFGAQNAINLFKRAIRSAFNSVKELDEIMTQTAVVTKFDVSDMWDQLPEYTERANALGVAISDAYKSATLFYQQGLKTNEVIEVSNQTLKMARIAGLDAADATDKMTAALRGFNMEVNGTNAERISDVYSKLAAITASNVQEISTAMTKTASLASNAGMQFETTAAFLSQIIETTRESAETAGTALKTVIARFQELKKSPDEIGEVDGEIIDANKIEGALRTVGVALRDASGQFRDLDQVFIELASKWDSLDTNTQRYIATIAAGSRQQSRFIAMMSDYKRTTELVEAANNAAGASTQQYEKTLESMETVLNRLKNAWNEFTMGIANSSILKAALNVLTGIVNAINNLTKVLGSTFGGFAKLGIAIGGLKAGGKIFDALTLSFKKFRKDGVGPATATTKAFGETLKTGFIKFRELAQKTFSKNTWVGVDEFKKKLVYLNNTFDPAKPKDYKKGINDLIKEYNIGTEQTKAYKAAIKAGVPVEQASLLLTNEKAAAEYNAAIANKEDAKATYERIAAEQLDNNVQAGLLTKLKAYLVLLFSSSEEKRKNAAATLGKVIAEKAEDGANKKTTASQWKLNTAIWACPLFWFAIAIAAVVAGLVVLIKYLNSTSDAARLERLNETIDATNEELENTKQCIDDINSAKQELDTMEDTFSKMAKGSAEWKQQLLKINETVLDLVETYPQLAQYITRGSQGELSITDKGFDEVLSAQVQKQAVLSNTLISAQASKNILESGLIWGLTSILNTRQDSTFLEELAAEQMGYNLNDYDDAKEYYKNTHDETLNGFEDFYTNLQNTIPALENFKDKVRDTIDAQEAYTQSLIANTISSGKLVDSEFTDQLNNIGEFHWNDILSSIETETSKMNKKTGGEKGKDESEQRKKYMEITGKTESEAKEESWETINRTVAIDKYQKEMEEYFEKLNAKLKQISNVKTGDRALRLLTSEGKKMTNKDRTSIEAIMGITFKELAGKTKDEKETYINKYLNSINESVETLGIEVETIVKDGLLNSRTYDKAYRLLESLGIDDRFTSQVSAEGASGLVKQLAYIATSAGTDAAKKLQSQLDSVFDKTGSIEDIDKIASILNGMDWKSAESWENLFDNIISSGVVLTEEVSNGLKDFANNARKIAGAVRKIDFDTLIEKTQFLGKTVKDINEGSQGRAFDSSAYETLISYNKDLASDFQLSLSGEYIYLGNSMNDLKDAIESNTVAILQDANKQLIARKNFKDKVYGRLSNKLTNSEIQSSSPEELQDVLQEIITSSMQNGINLDDLGINGLGNSTIAHAIKDKGTLQEILTNINNISWTEIDKQHKAVQSSARSIEYQTNSGSFNAARANYLFTNLQKENEKISAIDSDLQKEANITTTNPIKKLFQKIQYQVEKTKLQNQKSLVMASKELYEDDFRDTANALIVQAQSFGVNEKLISDYSTELEKFFEKGIAYSGNLLDLQQQIGNSIGLLYSNKQMQQYLNNVHDLVEQYDKIDDVQTKIIKANQMLGAFGLETVSEQDADKYINYLYGMAQGDKASYYELIKQSAKAAGLNFEDKDLEKLLNSDDENWSKLRERLINAGVLIGGSSGENNYARFLTETELNTNSILSGAKDEWENPYDYLVSTNEKINSLIWRRKALERDYQNMVNSSVSSAQKMIDNLKRQRDLLEQQKEEQKSIINNTQDQIDKLVENNSKFGKLFVYDELTQTVLVDDQAVENEFKNNSREGEKFKEFIEELKQLRDKIRESNEELDNINDSIEENKKIGKEQFLQLEQNIFNSLIHKQEEEIDRLSQINESVNDANSKLIDSLQSNIDKMRQDRENEKAEKDIEDKQRRLDYLMMDTSGANALEIIKLQDEIADAQESYTDSLVDQSIQQLQDQNQIAQEQREEQIELMRSQLEYAQKTGALWSSVYEKINKSSTTDLIELLKEDAGYYSMSTDQQKDWLEQTYSMINLGKIWSSGALSTYSSKGTGSNSNFGESNAAGQKLNDVVSYDYETLAAQGNNGTKTKPNEYKTLESEEVVEGRDLDSYLKQEEEEKAKREQERQKQEAEQTLRNQFQVTNARVSLTNGEEYKDAARGFNWADLIEDTKTDVGEIEWKDNKGTWRNSMCTAHPANYSTVSRLATEAGLSSGQVVKFDDNYYVIKDWGGARYAFRLSGVNVHKDFTSTPAFKTGGYADFTGPAWLDGTPSHPEAVLSASDTERFIALIDTLRSLEADGAGSSGDNYFDINIEVGSVSGDYDVERMADKIKEIIVNDAAYRNVNSINLIQ